MVLIAVFLAVLFPQSSHAEYNRATAQDELIFVSTQREVRMGESLAKKVEKKFKLASDVLLQKKIDGIGQDIARVCDRRDISYHFKVLSGSDLKPEQRINAFALPGGYVFMFKDLVDKLESDDEIAAVLAHEVGHICAKHSIKRLQGSLGAMALQVLTSRMESDRETKAKAYSAINLLMLAYSREDEFMADRLGVKYSKLAGYNPEGAIKVIEMLADMQREAPIRRYTGYRTHPYLAERKAMIKQEVYGQMDFEDFINKPTE